MVIPLRCSYTAQQSFHQPNQKTRISTSQALRLGFPALAMNVAGPSNARPNSETLTEEQKKKQEMIDALLHRVKLSKVILLPLLSLRYRPCDSVAVTLHVFRVYFVLFLRMIHCQTRRAGDANYISPRLPYSGTALLFYKSCGHHIQGFELMNVIFPVIGWPNITATPCTRVI